MMEKTFMVGGVVVLVVWRAWCGRVVAVAVAVVAARRE